MVRAGAAGHGSDDLAGKDAADSAGEVLIARALAVTYGVGVILALWWTRFGPFNALLAAVGLDLLLKDRLVPITDQAGDHVGCPLRYEHRHPQRPRSRKKGSKDCPIPMSFPGESRLHLIER